ncbi:hypothetical protein FJ428_07940 [Mesorhizobium sp. B2-8-1]|nr:hypothetical protein FJ428_07940 [Mesorhizobium sp. B2-8-1]
MVRDPGDLGRAWLWDPYRKTTIEVPACSADYSYAKGSAVQLEVFKGARHAFTSRGLKTGTEEYGHRVEYNAAAADQSENDVRAFLRGVFGN